MMNCFWYKDYRILVREKYNRSFECNIYTCEIYSANDDDNVLWSDDGWHRSSERAEEIARIIVNNRLDKTYDYKVAIGINDGGITYSRSLAIAPEDLQKAIDTQEIDRSLLLTPDDLIWLREWLPKLAANSELEYQIHVYPPRNI